MPQLQHSTKGLSDYCCCDLGIQKSEVKHPIKVLGNEGKSP